MPRRGEYVLVFAATVLLQAFLFDNLNLSPYLYPLIYVGFLLLLPTGMNHALLILCGFVTGVTVDFLSGTAGLHTIASTATAFIRPATINLTIGKDTANENVMPLPINVGRGKWLKYAALAVSIHCIVFFCFEAATTAFLWYTLLRAGGSALATFLLVWFAAAIYPVRGSH